MTARLKTAVAVLAKNTGLLGLQAGGLALFAYGLFLLAPWLGLAVAGLAIFALGWLLDGDDS